MLIRRPDSIASSEITPHRLYLGRREFMQGLGIVAAGLVSSRTTLALPPREQTKPPAFPSVRPGSWGTTEKRTSYEDATTFNNFYELGTGKRDPARLAGALRPRPWTVQVDGECTRPGRYAVDDLARPQTLEERVYRMRCVEGWSMVIPWVGVPLADVIRRAEPTSKARFVEFTTLHDPRQLPGQRSAVLEWPYVEGLRLDEALHPLTLLAVGLYGVALPGQSGAPLRLVVPWKYGFKSIKSIVRIRFVGRQPISSWQRANPTEYGFYANVNPAVPHPRWSQATERRVGEDSTRDTLMFNGYADQVAGLYSGLDLRTHF